MPFSGLVPYFNRLVILSLFLIVGTEEVYTQSGQQSPDEMSKQELWEFYSNEKKSDSSRVYYFRRLIWNFYLFTSTDSALILSNQGIDYAQQSNYVLKSHKRQSISSFYSCKGIAYSLKGNQNKAIDQFKKGIETLGDTEHELNYRATLLNNVGNVYSEQGNIPSAIDAYMKSLRIKEQLEEKQGVGNALSNLARLYLLLDNDEKAKKYSFEAQSNYRKVNDTSGIANTYFSLATHMLSQSLYDSCQVYLDSALYLFTEINNKVGLSGCYITYSKLEIARDNLISALHYSEQALALNEQLNSRSGTAECQQLLAEIYLKMQNLDKAELFVDSAFEIASSLNNESTINPIRKTKYQLEKRKGNTGEALKFYEQYVAYRDSIKRGENKELLAQRKYEYQYEKEKIKDSLARVEQDKLMQEKLKRQELEISQNTQRTIFLVVLVLVIVVFALIIFKRLKTSQRQRALIERQKQEVQEQRNELDEKNREVMDSIQYAKRLQHAILPSTDRFQQSVRSHFVYFNPKDVVSGDFFWMEQMNGSVYIAAADCTGHGVPGAMVSFICSNALTKTVVEDRVIEPANILNQVKDIVINHFDKGDEGIHDGMDISLVKITPYSTEENSDYKLIFSGANNPLWLMRDQKIHAIKGDKQPVGRYDYAQTFTQHEIEGFKDDILYLFSDGYVDQFGGPTADKGGKKFKSPKFKELLASVAHLTLEEQRTALEEAFIKWQGPLPQTDDVVVLGIKL